MGPVYHYFILLSIFINISHESNLLSHINFEKYYFMEEELIGLSRAIVEIERKGHDQDDVHGIFKHLSSIDHARDIHQDVEDYEEYLKHPINIFHLAKRLAKEWRDTVKALLESSLCVNDLKVKLLDIEDNLPTDEEFVNITHTVFIGLQKYNGFSIADVLEGVVNEHPAHETVSLEDALHFGLAADSVGNRGQAIAWLEFVVNEIGDSLSGTGKRSTGKIFSMLATMYLRNNDIDKALATTERILILEPNNKVAKRNKEYFLVKKSTGNGHVPETEKKMEQKSKRLRDKLCSGGTTGDNKELNRRHVAVETWDDSVLTRKTYLDAIVVRTKPLIVHFPGIISNETSVNITMMGYGQMLEKIVNTNKYGDPTYRVKVADTSGPYTLAIRKQLSEVKLTRYPPQNSRFEVLNIGMEGYHRVAKKVLGTSFSGTMFVALSEPTLGGDVVFPMSKAVLRLQKGDVVFYEAGTTISVCPVMYGSQWYGSMGVFEALPHSICGLEKRVIRI